MKHKNTRRGFAQAIQVRQNIFFTSPLEGEDVCRTDEGVVKRKTLFCTPSPRCWRTRPLPPGARETAHGFTLIELLVVVLIIGILAAVAVPQYQKAVEKSRAAEAMQILKSLRDAQALCILEHGPSSDACGWGDGGTQGIGELFDNISVDIPGEIVSTPFDGDGIQTKYFQYGVMSIDDDVAGLCASRSISSDDGYTICTSANPNGGVYYNQFICTNNTAQWCPSLGFKQSGSNWIL